MPVVPILAFKAIRVHGGHQLNLLIKKFGCGYMDYRYRKNAELRIPSHGLQI